MGVNDNVASSPETEKAPDLVAVGAMTAPDQTMDARECVCCVLGSINPHDDYDRQLFENQGNSRIYKGPGGVPTPVSDAVNYAYRDHTLEALNAVEFGLMFEVRRMDKNDREWLERIRKRNGDVAPVRAGRPKVLALARMPFPPPRHNTPWHACFLLPSFAFFLPSSLPSLPPSIERP